MISVVALKSSPLCGRCMDALTWCELGTGTERALCAAARRRTERIANFWWTMLAAATSPLSAPMDQAHLSVTAFNAGAYQEPSSPSCWQLWRVLGRRTEQAVNAPTWTGRSTSKCPRLELSAHKSVCMTLYAMPAPSLPSPHPLPGPKDDSDAADAPARRDDLWRGPARAASSASSSSRAITPAGEKRLPHGLHALRQVVSPTCGAVPAVPRLRTSSGPREEHDGRGRHEMTFSVLCCALAVKLLDSDHGS
jgi:hypothetical protein